MTGVYKITNLMNGFCYVGSSVDIPKRWKQHMSRYKNEKLKYYELPLYVAFREFGIENFKFEVLELCEEKHLAEKEQKFYEKFNPEYNKKQPKDCIMAEETRYKIKESMKESFRNYGEDKKKKIYENLRMGQNTDGFIEKKYAPKKIRAIKISNMEEVIFDSLYQAEKELGIPRSSICQVMSKKHSRKQAKGYLFEYILQPNTVPSQEK